jgi:hypothetical protein
MLFSNALFRLDVEAFDFPRQRAEQEPYLQSGEVRAKASVRSGTECHVTPGIVAPDVKTIRIRELSRIAIGGAVENDRARAFGQRDSVQIIVARHVARETLDRLCVPKT